MTTAKKADTKPAVKKQTKDAVIVKSLADLEKDLAAKQQDMLDAKRTHQAGDLVNPRILTVTRKEIARLHTAIRAEKIKESK